MQKWVTKEYVIPFVFDQRETGELDVLEIGCAEAGVLAAFLEAGHRGVGIELSPSRSEKARSYLKAAIDEGKASIINSNIYDIDAASRTELRFDLIVLKDVIEHIPNQEKFIPVLKAFLKPNGKVFFGYPPWWMPFGGHQQICSNKLLSVMPWFHLFPTPIYKMILRIFGESSKTIDELIEIKETGINIERMYSILANSGYQIEKEKLWFINPIYKKKFGLTPRTSFVRIPFLRNVFSTCHYILFLPK